MVEMEEHGGVALLPFRETAKVTTHREGTVVRRALVIASTMGREMEDVLNRRGNCNVHQNWLAGGG